MLELTQRGTANQQRHVRENIRPQGLQCNFCLQRLKAHIYLAPVRRSTRTAKKHLIGVSLFGACEFDQSPQAKMAEIALSLAMRLVQEIAARILQEMFIAAKEEAALLRDVPENTRCHPNPLPLSLCFHYSSTLRCHQSQPHRILHN